MGVDAAGQHQVPPVGQLRLVLDVGAEFGDAVVELVSAVDRPRRLRIRPEDVDSVGEVVLSAAEGRAVLELPDEES